MADETILEQSLTDESGSPASFVDKQYLYVTDQNNGSYTGTISIDTTSLSNSGAYLSYSESFLVIPIVLQMYSSVLDAKKVDFGMALKAGYWNLIHSLSVDFNNKSVVQQTPFLNVFTSFKCLTSWSEEDVKNWGKVTGFKPDTSDSWLFNTAAAAAANGLAGNGTGLCMNRLVTTVPFAGSLSDAEFAIAAVVQPVVVNTEVTGLSDSSLSCANEGLLQRMKWLNFDLEVSSPAPGVAGSVSANKVALLGGNASGLNSLFKAYVQTSADNRAIVFPAIIRMKDICDFMAKAPLLKGGTVRIQITTNQSFTALKQVAGQLSAAGALTAYPALQLASAPIILGGGGTNPVMVSSADLGQGLTNIVPVGTGAPGAAADVLVACSIVRSQFASNMPAATVYSAPITSVRFYAPAYTMSPQEEAKYLSAQSTKKIVYEDIFQYSYTGIAPGDFQQLVTNGLPNLKSIVVMGMLPVGSNGTAAGTAGVYVGGTTSSTLLSPFCGTGGCPDPIGITNFQVQLSGKNLFNDQLQYDFQEFVNQLVSSNQMNGSHVTGMGSGLIGADDFSNLFRYYFADCSRGLPSDAGVARSIQISGKNTSSVTINLMVFASFQRSIVLDLRSGAVIA